MRASSVAGAPSRSSRRSTKRPTAGGPTVSTAAAASAVGSTCAASSAATSSRRNNGFPPVASWQAALNALVDLGPEAAAQHLRHGRLGQEARSQDLGGGVARELAPELLAVRVRGTGRGEQQHRQTLDPAREVAEELHR